MYVSGLTVIFVSQVQKFHSVLHMVLRGIPKPRPLSSDTDNEEMEPKKVMKAGSSLLFKTTLMLLNNAF